MTGPVLSEYLCTRTDREKSRLVGGGHTKAPVVQFVERLPDGITCRAAALQGGLLGHPRVLEILGAAVAAFLRNCRHHTREIVQLSWRRRHSPAHKTDPMLGPQVQKLWLSINKQLLILGAVLFISCSAGICD